MESIPLTTGSHFATTGVTWDPVQPLPGTNSRPSGRLTLLQLTVGIDPDSWCAERMLRSAASPATTEHQTPGHNPKSSVSPKPVSVLVTCSNCGYENLSQYRYCGMCRAALRLPPQEVARRTGGGPSPLGLTEIHAEDADASYLLKDDPIPRHRGQTLVFVVVVAAAAVLAWYWREDLRAWSTDLSRKPAANETVLSGTPSVPAGTTNPDASGSKGETASGNQSSAPLEQSPGPGPPSASASPAMAAHASEVTDGRPTPPSLAEGEESESTKSVKPEEQPEYGSGKAVVPASTAGARSSARSAIEFETDGEKYLYGNSVPQNCALARQKLWAAAQHSNSKAQTVLGTMYATGHCASRDLPRAYHWFAQALRHDPNNTRIEQDLKVLWNQMTPAERNLALRR